MSILSEQNKDFARWAMHYATENGCDAARARLVASVNNSLEYRDGKLDRLEGSTENSLQIELFVDQKYGVFSSNRLNKEELAIFIREGINSVRYLAVDKCRRLPNSDRYYNKASYLDLGLWDEYILKLTTEQRLAVAEKAASEIVGIDSDILSITSAYDDYASSVYFCSSDGFEAETNSTSCSLTVSVSLKTEGDARAEDYWYDVAAHWSDLQKEGIATKAYQGAKNKIGQAKIASGKYDMLLDNTTIGRLLSPLFGALYGSSIQQKRSFLIDKLGQKIISDKVTIIDEPFQVRSIGSRLFDGEGVATQQQVVIEKGVLKMYYIDTYNSEKLNIPPTISSYTGLCMNLGTKNCDQLKTTIKQGIWVTGFNGGNTNPTTGDFSFGVEGFFIENGRVTKPISEMNITGNLLSLWNNVKEVGNDPKEKIATKLPSILFEGVSFSGL